MAPDNHLLNAINELLKIRSKVDVVEDVDQLFDAKDTYSNWYFKLHDTLSKEKIEALDFQYTDDEVLQSVKRGGTGIDFNDPQAQLVLSALNNEIRRKLPILKKLLKSKQFLVKNGQDFYFMDKFVNIKQSTISYRFLNTIYLLHSDVEVIKYDTLAKKFKLSNKSDHEVKKILSNSRDNVFGRSKLIDKNGDKTDFTNQLPNGKKLIETKRGSGFVLNNTL